tara:strand:+ start:20544 stop:20789 length:246 start_codon:yes stop_codon:yes gene_type:complete
MSATLKFVKPEHEDILREYLDNEGVVLVFGKEAQQDAIKHGYEDNEELDGYDFGGEADIFVEKASNKSHNAFNFMAENPID